jgi:hypothetical protein
METYAEAYERVLDKCKDARDKMRSSIEIQVRSDARDGFMLLSHHKSRGFVAIEDPDSDLREWVGLVVEKLIEMGLCEGEPVEEHPF